MDAISDMITRIKNASAVGKTSVLIPLSNLKLAIAEVLREEGFVGSVSKKGKKGKKFIEVGLLYENDEPRIHGVSRLSHLSRRSYLGARAIRSVKNGTGRLILTTPNGVRTGENARKERVGGEALFTIW